MKFYVHIFITEKKSHILFLITDFMSFLLLLYTEKIFTLLKILCPFTGKFILLIQTRLDLILILTPQVKVRTVNLS